ncbi:unnamed protein product [Ilex paraguariensis]|uniref:Uncharacterized protein n=1 Tax=Ilex paraguariensis TaxID=185542 RepID=A0ABC8S1N6_9AQUA
MEDMRFMYTLLPAKLGQEWEPWNFFVRTSSISRKSSSFALASLAMVGSLIGQCVGSWVLFLVRYRLTKGGPSDRPGTQSPLA